MILLKAKKDSVFEISLRILGFIDNVKPEGLILIYMGHKGCTPSILTSYLRKLERCIILFSHLPTDKRVGFWTRESTKTLRSLISVVSLVWMLGKGAVQQSERQKNNNGRCG